ncbi:MAG: hypothetical protein OQJ84_05730 [Xanthomonadales bacterium]|nr:hypothetical protein [Xanthomonadales bacterium]
MIRAYGYLVTVVLMLLSATYCRAGDDPIRIGDLPPGEQYRQLSLVVLMAAGARPELIDAMTPDGEANGGRTDINPDDYKTPLFRIVDQESMLAGAAFLLRYAHESAQDIQTRMAAIKSANPVLISMVDVNAITEDAIIIRNAIADSIAYSDRLRDEATRAHLQDYRIRTTRIRNVMEFKLFEAELARLTEEAILSVGGKLDAYQRMFDEEVDSKEFDRQFDAADYIYNRSEKFDLKAGKLTEEIMKNVIFSEGQPGQPDP